MPRNPTRLLHEVRINTNLRWKLLWTLLYYPSQWALGVLAIFAAIGGTMMHLLGVYSMDLCRVTAIHWFQSPEKRPMVVLSLNTQQMIHNAKCKSQVSPPPRPPLSIMLIPGRLS